MATKQVMVVSSFHCDLVWRRTPEEQAAIRGAQIGSALDMLERFPEFRFEFDQAWAVREYLQAHPEQRAPLARYLAEGRVDVTGGEESIPDTNMVSGEGLVRNIFLGRLWFAEEFGVHPIVANMDDAFGLNAQLPQIFQGFGYQYFRDARTPGLDSKLANDGILWEGLDGSRIFYLSSHGGITEHTHVCNLPVVYTHEERAHDSLAQAIQVDKPVVYCAYSSEEDLATEEIIRMVLDWKLPKGATMRFALGREVLAEIRRHAPNPPVVKGEFNPSQAGTHISRISLKQAYRRAEWATIVAEAAIACAALRGASYPQDRLADMWRKLAFVQFHDVLCGCHCDAVYQRLMDYCAGVSHHAAAISGQAMGPDGNAGVALFNPLLCRRQEPVTLALPANTSLAGADGLPLPAQRHGEETLLVADLAPLGTTTLHMVPTAVPESSVLPGNQAAGQTIEVGTYRITPRHDGMRIEQAAWGRTLADGAFPQVRFRLEDGTLWDERFLGTTFTEEAGEGRLACVEQGPVATRLIWQGEIHGDPQADPLPPVWQAVRDGKPVVYADLRHLYWEKELTFYRDIERIDVTVRLDWEGRNTEILLGFPLLLDLAKSKALYEIPCGMIERKPYFEVPVASPEAKDAPFHLAKLGGKGAWPALTWVAYRDQAWGMVLANTGTPSHRLMSGMIEVGVLRSPTTMGSNMNVPVSAHEHGRHEFRFALQPFQGDLRKSRAYELGPCLNAAPLVQMTGNDAAGSSSLLSLDAPGVAFSAFKHTERGEGYILRTFETMGKTAGGRLHTAFPLAVVQECDLMEQPLREVDPKRLRWRPFEIKTLRILPGT
ncbi:MAG: glycoside hydrolase family 38 N-terminal domain-containing protein [Armatimonadota bacterium]